MALGVGQGIRILTCMQQLSIIMVSNLILGYSSATSSQHCRNSPSPNFLRHSKHSESPAGPQQNHYRSR